MLKSLVNLLRTPTMPSLAVVSPRLLHVTSFVAKEDKRNMIANMPRRDEGTSGENTMDTENIIKKSDIFPDINTPDMLFDGVPFKEIPIINVKCSKNNTLISVTDHEGLVHIYHTCGAEGFHGSRRGTNVAAQATAITVSQKALEKGFRTVRVRVRGLGPGRMASLKGLQMGGMNIISVTDNTRVTWTPLRPRKARRL